MDTSCRLSAILFFCSLIWFDKCWASCGADDVAVYRVVFKTLWSEENFPKDYPMNRPKAQWAPLFGQTHNSSYILFKIGDIAKASIRKYAQFGKLDELVDEGDEEAKIYDQFSTKPIGTGVGEAENMVFADGGHSLISLICRLVPSPDWFVGVDSFDLCIDSSWIEEVTLDLGPLDAGAASGLTFTAPRWETSPPDPVTRHKPRSPNHPAAGFYYPNERQLPTIAKVQLIKIKEYTTKKLNEMARQELLSLLKRKDIHKGVPIAKQKAKSAYKHSVNEFTTKNYMEQLKDLEEEPFGTPKADVAKNIVEIITKSPITSTSTTTEGEFGNDLQNMDDVVLAVANGRKLGLGKHLPRHFRSRLHHAVNRVGPDDCLVTEWGEWTACSVTCGFGDKFRTRTVLRKPKKDGRKCPPLRERTHCGNVNSCYEIEYFDW